MEITTWNLHQGNYNMEFASWNLHYGIYIIEFVFFNETYDIKNNKEKKQDINMILK